MARRIPREFVPSDVNMAMDPAIMRAGAMAELLFRRGNEYAKKNNRDGDIYELDLPLIGLGIPKPKAAAEALVREGLWLKTKDGWLIRSYLKWNLSRSEQEEKREANRVGAIKSNHKQGRHAANLDPECPLCDKGAK